MDIPEILQFRIDVFTPDTIPMSKLAKYMAELASLYGSETLVHFDKMRKGSAILQSKVEQSAINAVGKRLQLVHDIDAPDELVKIYQNINQLLRADNAVGTLKREHGAVILKFPGRETVTAKTYKVREAGILDGVVIRIGGKDNSIPIWIQDLDGTINYCEANTEMARDLAKHYLGAPIRVTGQGDWIRGADSLWKLDKFKISGWSLLDVTPLDQILQKARQQEGNGWNQLDDPIKEHLTIRGLD